MAELKTKKNKKSVSAFLKSIADDRKRKDAETIMKMMKRITKETPTMWGDSIVGFGSYHYVYDSGREGDWFVAGFAPRKRNLTLYVMSGFKRHDPLMKKLGKYKTGMSCLYITKLDDIDMDVLEDLVKESVKHMRKAYA
ncbi:MAG: DUF1801 domain-containing protein [Gemmatimonadales bacterium]